MAFLVNGKIEFLCLFAIQDEVTGEKSSNLRGSYSRQIRLPKYGMFSLFLEIFIRNMQFIYTGICLNNLRYELHKLHFPNFSKLLRPPMARAQTTLCKKQQF